MSKTRIKALLEKMVFSRYFPFFITVILFALLYTAGLANYRGFKNPQVFLNLFIDNASTILITIGLTFVIISGGIDISCGSVLALSCMTLAWLLEHTALPLGLVLLIVLLQGFVFGMIQGFLITKFQMQAFIVTLAGQFLARGLTAMISVDTIIISNESFVRMAGFSLDLGIGNISLGGLIAILALLVGTLLLRYTKWSRNVYAMGGNALSAYMMGLPVDRTRITVYTLSGLMSALAGILFGLYTLSGYPLHALGMELEGISSSVIGGTMLSGGVGFLPGTLFGVLIQGVIQTLITFQGTLSAWWTKIVIGVLLCLAIILQSILDKSRARRVKR